MRRFLAALGVFLALVATSAHAVDLRLIARGTGGVAPAVFRAASGFKITSNAGQTWTITATGATAGDLLIIWCQLDQGGGTPTIVTNGTSQSLTVISTDNWTNTADNAFFGKLYKVLLASGDISAGNVATTITEATSGAGGNEGCASAIYHGPTTVTKKSYVNNPASGTGSPWTLVMTGYTPSGSSMGAVTFATQRVNAGNAAAVTMASGWTARFNTPGGAGDTNIFYPTISDNLSGVTSTTYTWSNWANVSYSIIAGIMLDLS